MLFSGSSLSAKRCHGGRESLQLPRLETPQRDACPCYKGFGLPTYFFAIDAAHLTESRRISRTHCEFRLIIVNYHDASAKLHKRASRSRPALTSTSMTFFWKRFPSTTDSSYGAHRKSRNGKLTCQLILFLEYRGQLARSFISFIWKTDHPKSI